MSDWTWATTSAAHDRYVTGNWGEDQFRDYPSERPTPGHCEACGGFLNRHADTSEVIEETHEYQGDSQEDTALRWPIAVPVWIGKFTCSRCGHVTTVRESAY